MRLQTLLRGSPRIMAMLVFLAMCLPALAAERIPPVPKQYFNDYAGVVSKDAAARLNARLEQFERDSSNQLVVAIYPKMESDSSIEDYTVRVAESWKAGQKGRKNGIVLFVFTQDRRLYIQVGYGLEGALPDATAKQIIDTQITPRLKQGDLEGGMAAGIDAIIAATKGEYKGTDRTAPQTQQPQTGVPPWFIVAFIVLFALLSILRRAGGMVYGRSGYRSYGSWGGFSGGSGGGGGFSGGGGSFGGGGAGGSW